MMLITIGIIPLIYGSPFDICDVLWVTLKLGYRWSMKQCININMFIGIKVDAMVQGAQIVVEIPWENVMGQLRGSYLISFLLYTRKYWKNGSSGRLSKLHLSYLNYLNALKYIFKTWILNYHCRPSDRQPMFIPEYVLYSTSSAYSVTQKHHSCWFISISFDFSLAK